MTTSRSNEVNAPTFEPRLGGLANRPAPFNPQAYFFVALFGGFVAVALIALMNLERLANVPRLRERTYAVAALTIVGGVALAVFAPASWFVPASSIRMGARVVAVVGGALLMILHRGPSAVVVQHDGNFTSAWRAIGWIIAGALLQGIALLTVALARGIFW